MGIGQVFYPDRAVGNLRARQYASIQAHPSYRADLIDSNHYSFSDSCAVSLFLGDTGFYTSNCIGVIQPWLAHQLVTKYMIAFLKTHLAGETALRVRSEREVSNRHDLLSPGSLLSAPITLPPNA